MPVLVYHFLDRIEKDPTFMLEDGQSRMKPDEVQPMVEEELIKMFRIGGVACTRAT
jgi:hypothetical protein